LPDILVWLEMLAKKEKEERIRREEEHKVWLEKQKIENELKEKKDNEFKRFKRMFHQANLLHKANILRDYVKSVEKCGIIQGRSSQELHDWVDWANNKINWFDPLINQTDPILNDEYKDLLYDKIKKGIL